MMKRSTCKFCQALVQTVKLGSQVFNPFRFNGVLRVLARDPVGSTVSAEDMKNYWQAAERCFKEPSNVRLVPVTSVVETLAILKKDFPQERAVYDSLLTSLAGAVRSRAKLVEVTNAAERTQLIKDREFVKSVISSNIHVLRKNDWKRIAFVQYADNPKECISYLVNLTDRDAINKLTNDQIVTVVTIGGDDACDVFLEVLESNLRGKLSSADIVEKVSLLTQVLALASRGDYRVKRALSNMVSDLCEVADILSSSQAVELLCFFPPPCEAGIKVWNHLVWRLDRDPWYLASLEGGRIAMVLNEICAMTDSPKFRSLLMTGLRVPLQRARISPVQLCEISEALGRRWLSEREIAEIVFSRILLVREEHVLDRLVKSVLSGLGVNDIDVANKFLDRFNGGSLSSEARVGIIESIGRSTERSRVGNLVLAALLNKGANDFDKIVIAMKTHGSIPLHAHLSDLSSGQLIQILELLGDDKVGDLELVAEATALQVKEPIENQLELLRQLAARGVPSEQLVSSIAKRFNEITLQDKLEFLSCCRKTRVIPEGSFVADLVAWREGSPEEWAAAFNSLAHLGLLNDDKMTSKLVEIFLDSCSGVDGNKRALLSGQILASLFVGLKLPSERQWTRLVSMIAEDLEAIDRESMAMIAEMNPVVKNPLLAETLIRIDWSKFNGSQEACIDRWGSAIENGVFEKGRRVGITELTQVDLLNGKDGVMIARPEDMMNDGSLSPMFKWRLFVIQQYGVTNIQIRNWTSLC